MKLFPFLLLSLFMSTALSLYAKDIEVKSTPEAVEIALISPDSNQKIILGSTPYAQNYSKIKEAYTGEAFILEFSKEGYKPYRIFFPRPSLGIDIHVKLGIDSQASFSRAVDNVARDLFEAQRLIRIGNYDQAIDALSILETSFPFVSTVAEMKGSAYYLKKDFQSSLGAYRKALSLNPENFEANSMTAYLEKSLGIDNHLKTNTGPVFKRKLSTEDSFTF